MKTKVLIVTQLSLDAIPNSEHLQGKVDTAIAKAGKGWTVKSAQTAVAYHPPTARGGSGHYEEYRSVTIHTTTIVLEKV